MNEAIRAARNQQTKIFACETKDSGRWRRDAGEVEGVGGSLAAGFREGVAPPPSSSNPSPLAPTPPPCPAGGGGGVGDKEPVAFGVWGGFERGANMGNPKAGARRKRVAESKKVVEEKRGSAADKADFGGKKEKAQRVGGGVSEKLAQGGAGRSAERDAQNAVVTVHPRRSRRKAMLRVRAGK